MHFRQITDQHIEFDESYRLSFTFFPFSHIFFSMAEVSSYFRYDRLKLIKREKCAPIYLMGKKLSVLMHFLTDQLDDIAEFLDKFFSAF